MQTQQKGRDIMIKQTCVAVGMVVGLAFPSMGLAVWPYDVVLEYECEEAMARKDETGWACQLVHNEAQGTAMEIAVVKGFPDDPNKQRQVNYDRAKLLSSFADAGGTRIHLFNLTTKDHTMQHCNRSTPLEAFWCGKWQPVPDSMK